MISLTRAHDGETSPAITLLVVEDDTLILSFASAVLRRAGYRVLSAGDGVDGAVLFARHFEEIHALVTDISLPGMRGLEFAQFARKIRSDLKVLFASGSMEEQSTKLKVQGSKYLAKPFTADQLLHAVESLLKGTSSSDGASTGSMASMMISALV